MLLLLVTFLVWGLSLPNAVYPTFLGPSLAYQNCLELRFCHPFFSFVSYHLDVILRLYKQPLIWPGMGPRTKSYGMPFFLGRVI